MKQKQIASSESLNLSVETLKQECEMCGDLGEDMIELDVVGSNEFICRECYDRLKLKC